MSRQRVHIYSCNISDILLPLVLSVNPDVVFVLYILVLIFRSSSFCCVLVPGMLTIYLLIFDSVVIAVRTLYIFFTVGDIFFIFFQGKYSGRALGALMRVRHNGFMWRQSTITRLANCFPHSCLTSKRWRNGDRPNKPSVAVYVLSACQQYADCTTHVGQSASQWKILNRAKFNLA